MFFTDDQLAVLTECGGLKFYAGKIGQHGAHKLVEDALRAWREGGETRSLAIRLKAGAALFDYFADCEDDADKIVRQWGE